MNIFEHNRHREALVRRRIKFVVETGAMARLFKGGTHAALQDELFRRVAPAILSALRTRDEMTRGSSRRWNSIAGRPTRGTGSMMIAGVIRKACEHRRLEAIAANRELLAEEDWRRLRPFLHVPIDSTVTYQLSTLDPAFRQCGR